MPRPTTVLVTGSREWLGKECRRMMRAELEKFPPRTLLIHGGCLGADSMADEFASEFGFDVWNMRAPWDLWGSAAGPIRNRAMLAALGECPDPKLVLVFHQDLSISKGTKDCLAEAKRRGFTCRIVPAL